MPSRDGIPKQPRRTRSGQVSLEVKERLGQAARLVALNAYAPYSHFRVGAAVLCGESIYLGCNVENASYGLTMCAERVAIFRAVADGQRNIDVVFVSCLDAENNAPASSKSPCGACRQVIQEFAHSGTMVIVDGVGDFSISDLLPMGFKLR